MSTSGSYAERAMRSPRKCKIIGFVAKNDSNPWEAWYYVESRGLDIMVRKAGIGTVTVKITARQLRQALDLIESTFETEAKP